MSHLLNKLFSIILNINSPLFCDALSPKQINFQNMARLKKKKLIYSLALTGLCYLWCIFRMDAQK